MVIDRVFVRESIRGAREAVTRRLSRPYTAECVDAGIEPLPDDEARELARRFHDLLAPAFEREFRLH